MTLWIWETEHKNCSCKSFISKETQKQRQIGKLARRLRWRWSRWRWRWWRQRNRQWRRWRWRRRRWRRRKRQRRWLKRRWWRRRTKNDDGYDWWWWCCGRCKIPECLLISSSWCSQKHEIVWEMQIKIRIRSTRNLSLDQQAYFANKVAATWIKRL